MTNKSNRPALERNDEDRAMKSGLSPQTAAFLENYERLSDEDKRAVEHLVFALAKLRADEMQQKYLQAANLGLGAEAAKPRPDVKGDGGGEPEK